MFKELGWLSVSDRLKYNKDTMIYKALNNQTPEYISNLLKPMSKAHGLNFRSSENGSFSCSASRLWNTLAATVKNSNTLKGFKQSLKLWF